MGYEAMVQMSLDTIDRRITETIRTDELARGANYSLYHFSRVFMQITGFSVQSYITRRKLEYAIYDLSRGRRVIDVAMDYGFGTHAGFTKAFKRCFGYPPSLYRLHVTAVPPLRATIEGIRKKQEEFTVQVQIREIKPFCVAGYSSRHRMPGVNGIFDIPVYWDKINLDYGAELSTLHHTYEKSHHCEVGLCFDIDNENECFTYMMGVGVDPADLDTPLRPGVSLHQIEGGVYAVFTTPRVDEDEYTRSILDTWKEILTNWLPSSEYIYDTQRMAFEYYDERDHAWLHEGKSCMDIFIPICRKA